MFLRDLLLKVIGVNFIIKDKYGDTLFDTRVLSYDVDENDLAMREFGDRHITSLDTEIYEYNDKWDTAFLIFYVD